jgi:hypothetical protein
MTKQVKIIFSFFLFLNFLSSGESRAATLYFVSHSPYIKSEKESEYNKELNLAQQASQIISLSKKDDIDLNVDDPAFFDLQFLYKKDLQYKKIPTLPECA